MFYIPGVSLLKFMPSKLAQIVLCLKIYAIKLARIVSFLKVCACKTSVHGTQTSLLNEVTNIVKT